MNPDWIAPTGTNWLLRQKTTEADLTFGAPTIDLRHAPRWPLALAGRQAGDVIRALAWLGRQRGAQITKRLATALSAQTIHDLSTARRRLPTWMAEQISHLVTRAGAFLCPVHRIGATRSMWLLRAGVAKPIECVTL